MTLTVYRYLPTAEKLRDAQKNKGETDAWDYSDALKTNAWIRQRIRI